MPPGRVEWLATRGRGSMITGWVLFGAGLVLVGGGTAFALNGDSIADGKVGRPLGWALAGIGGISLIAAIITLLFGYDYSAKASRLRGKQTALLPTMYLQDGRGGVARIGRF